MTADALPLLDADALKRLAAAKTAQCGCTLKICQGWESVTDERWPRAQMRLQGTLRQPLPEGQTEATFEEFHPNGTRYESPHAPVAADFFPFNRCDVYACTECGCAVLKYTEYGGYYVDHRARRVDADLVVVSPAP